MTMQKKTAGIIVSMLAVAGIALFGCSDQTKQAASNAMNDAAQDTRNNVQKADTSLKQTGHDAAVETKEAAAQADQSLKSGAHYVGKAVGGTVKDVAVGAHDAGKVLTMTPTVKDALIRSNVDTTSLNVDTDAKTNTVYLKGSVPTAAQKTEASQIAMRTIESTGKPYHLKNELTVK
jgi:ElaB/YqjD/DUF883 family membrane-anchored ribosome-binding protein